MPRSFCHSRFFRFLNLKIVCAIVVSLARIFIGLCQIICVDYKNEEQNGESSTGIEPDVVHFSSSICFLRLCWTRMKKKNIKWNCGRSILIKSSMRKSDTNFDWNISQIWCCFSGRKIVYVWRIVTEGILDLKFLQMREQSLWFFDVHEAISKYFMSPRGYGLRGLSRILWHNQEKAFQISSVML